jgi:hypothetical protein
MIAAISGKKTLLMVLVLLLSGCIMIDADLRLPDETVKPMLTGEDCVGIYFGIGTGTVRMTEAMKTYHNVQEVRQTSSGSEKVMVRGGLLIRRIHSVVLKDNAAFGFGKRCLVVTGEP